MAAVAAEGTEGADDDRANEANVATVAAGDTAGAEGAVSDVSSEEFCQGRREDPLAAADMQDLEESIATHGEECMVSRLVAEFMDTHGGGVTPLVHAPDNDLHQRVAEMDDLIHLARDEADRRALAMEAAALAAAIRRSVAHEVAQSRSRA